MIKLHWSIILAIIVGLIGLYYTIKVYPKSNESGMAAPFFAFFSLIIFIATILIELIIGGIFWW